MPFEFRRDAAETAPRSFADPASADLDLPDDLAALAEQLSEDAAYLEGQYAAGCYEVWASDSSPHPNQQEPPPRRGRNRLVWGGAAAASVLLLLAGAVWVQSLSQDQRPAAQLDSVESPRKSLQLEAPADAANSDRASAGQEASARAAEPSEPARSPVVPAGLFENLSGPEQEALLDLIESKGYEQSSLSI